MTVEAPVSQKTRLDVRLVSLGLAPSREKAQALVMAGRVRVNGRPATKSGASVGEDDAIDVLPGPTHVGRGALKLLGALEAFDLSPAGRIAVDVGSSTGGFTETLLAKGAVRVYAIDVGRGQIHETLRGDSRVVLREGVNARRLGKTHVPEPCGFATVDVSFISVLKILTPLRAVLDDAADVVVLVKPQFEVGRGQVGRGGVVRDPKAHAEVVGRVARAAQAEHGYAVRAVSPSPITGTDGNREFFLHLRLTGPARPDPDLGTMIEAAVRT